MDIIMEKTSALVQAHIVFLYASEGALMLNTHSFLSMCELS